MHIFFILFWQAEHTERLFGNIGLQSMQSEAQCSIMDQVRKKPCPVILTSKIFLKAAFLKGKLEFKFFPSPDRMYAMHAECNIIWHDIPTIHTGR